MTCLCCVVEKTSEHPKLYCAVCQKYEDRIREMKLGILGQVIKKLAMSWIMPFLALLLHTVLSMTV